MACRTLIESQFVFVKVPVKPVRDAKFSIGHIHTVIVYGIHPLRVHLAELGQTDYACRVIENPQTANLA